MVGQQHITQTLKSQVSSGRQSHAYLFIGTRGTGKTTCAKILSRAVNCESPVDGNPCNKCKACTGIESGSILDVVELDAASNNGVDNVRALRDEAVFSPASVKKRVYIIDEVHMLSTSAFNALLKILEEPPEHLMFILATTELHKVPATILSRCQRHNFKRLDSAVITERIEYVARQEDINLTHDAAELLGRLADGAMRDGLTLLDQCSGREIIDSDTILQTIGLAGSRRTAELLDAISQCDADAAMTVFRALWQDGKEASTILDELCTLERDVLMTIVAPRGGIDLLSGGFDMPVLRDFARRLSAGELMHGMDTLRGAMVNLRSCPNPRTIAELCIIEMCEPEQGTPLRQTSPRETNEPAREPKRQPQKKIAPAQDIEAEDEYVFEEDAMSDEEDFPPWEEPENVTVSAPQIDVIMPVENVQPESINAASESADESITSDGDVWLRMQPTLKSGLAMGVYLQISDDMNVKASVEDGVLVLRVKGVFTRTMISKPDVLELLKKAVVQAEGKAMPVKIADWDDEPAKGQGSLDAFAQFDNVKFE